MPGVVRSLITRILFRSDPTGLKTVTTHANTAKRSMRAASRAAWKLKRDLRDVGTGLRNWAIGAGAAVFMLGKLITGFSKGTDEQAKFAKGLGISIQEYQGMAHAADLSGISINELNVALPKLAQNAGNAADGSKAAKDAFKRAGIESLKLGKRFKTPIELMNELADNFKAGRFEGNKTQVLMNLFGRTGKKMGNLLALGSKGIKQAADEAKRLGLVLSDSEAKIAEDYTDEMTRVKAVMKGLRNIIMVQVLPAVIENARAFHKWAVKGDNLKKAADALIKTFKVLAIVLAAVAAAKVGRTIFALVQITKKAVFWTRLQGRATLLAYAPYIALAAAIAGVVLIIQSLWVWSKGGKSVVGELLEKFGMADKARKVMDFLGKAMVFLWKAIKVAGRVGLWYINTVMAQWQSVFREFEPEIRALGQAMVELYEELAPVVVAAAKAVAAGIQDLIRALGAAWQEIKPGLIELGAQLVKLWEMAKPGLEEWWAITQKVWGVIWSLALQALPLLGTMASNVFKGISTAIKVSMTSLTMFINGITYMIQLLKKAWALKNRVLDITKSGGTTTGAAAAASAAQPTLRRAALAGPQTNNISVGTVSATVQGTTNMSPEQMAKSMQEAVDESLQKFINISYAATKPLVPG